MDEIPLAFNLTTYNGGNEEFTETPNTMLVEITAWKMHVQVRKHSRSTRLLRPIAQIRVKMEGNSVGGKIVALT
jgi:hypothetical protein